MIEGRPSETALHTAAARAAHRLLDPEPHLLEDVRAAELLGADGEALIETYRDDGLWVLVENRIFIPLRARYVEDRLRVAYLNGARQYVVLGAGLDSFTFRQPAQLGELEIFEVDHPSTQDWKTARIDSLGWSVPDNVQFVPCDFETTSVSGALRDAGFNRVTDTCIPLTVMRHIDKMMVELWSTAADAGESKFNWEFFYQALDRPELAQHYQIPPEHCWVRSRPPWTRPGARPSWECTVGPVLGTPT